MCKKSFSWHNKLNKRLRERVWFMQWLKEGYSVRQLSKQSRHSIAKLYAIIAHWLSEPPPVCPLGGNHTHIAIDGTFLHRPVSIIAVYDTTTNTIIRGEYGVSETSEPQLYSFLQLLKDQGLSPVSCTIDGNYHVMRVLRSLWPHIIIQRCLVHVQRQGIMWCRRFPKRIDAQKLRNIFLLVSQIHTVTDRDIFLTRLYEWEQHYGKRIAQRTENGKVFSDLKRARSMLLKAIPDMFQYLNDPRISPTTNGLEGYFSRLKQHYKNHRGLCSKKHDSYFAWYFYARPR